MMLAGFCMLLNASYSMLQFRKYVQLHAATADSSGEADIHPPLDIQVEALIGMLTGIVAAIFK